MAELQWILELLRVPRGQRVLDVGCGGGALVARTSRAGMQAVGIDSNFSALRLARTQSRLRLLVAGSASELPFRDDAFAALTAQHVIEHFDHPEKVVREWRRVLQPLGQMILVTPNARYPDPDSFSDPTHRHIFQSNELHELLGREGMLVESSRALRPFLLNRKLELFACLGAKWFQRLPLYRDRGASLVVSARKS